MGFDQGVDRVQRHGAGANLIGQGGKAEINAFAGIAFGLTVQRLVLPELLEQERAIEGAIGPSPMASASRFGPAHPRRVGWKGAVRRGDLPLEDCLILLT